MAIETNTIKDLEFGSFAEFPTDPRGIGKLYIDSNGFLRVEMTASPNAVGSAVVGSAVVQ